MFHLVQVFRKLKSGQSLNWKTNGRLKQPKPFKNFTSLNSTTNQDNKNPSLSFHQQKERKNKRQKQKQKRTSYIHITLVCPSQASPNTFKTQI